ncbi:FGGY-family carbohydrate kinase [Trabulsiella odontotermitis]|uniref:FGGY-family carbohydrate kinase n=1 Tax=Trabulsiella odontotermitis TaxID=379893 RepID=UPI0006763D25|nr:FGGY-family carbohydrate kinase [Trabulsiella odontotermitis]KNC92322.1 carbohydrate kinase [Trabulsiella odontotermitis]
MPDYHAALVIDIGTTNCKVSCYSCHDASVLEVRKFPTPKKESENGDVDFDIDTLWQALRRVLAELISFSPFPVTDISITSFGESGVFVDEKGTILTPMLAWYDRRGESYLTSLSETENEELYAITGLPVHSNYSAFKMRWLLDNYALHDQKNICWLHAPEVLLWRLTGEKRTDISLASRTLCLDVSQRTWSRRATAILGIPFEVLAPLTRPGEVAGWVTPELRNELGLTHKVNVTLAGHDHMVGARALQMRPGDVLNSTGTTEGILLLNTQPTLNAQARRDKLANGCYSDGEFFTLFASLPVGGYALEWVQKTFRLNAEDISVGLEKVMENYLQSSWSADHVPIFIPHLRGAGSPNKNRHSRGLLFGLTDALDTETLLESVFIGLVMEFAHCYDCFTIPADSILKVIGPAVKNPFWLQLKADILQCPVEAITFDETVSVGALLMACPDVVLPSPPVVEWYLPDTGRSVKLKEYQQKWQAFYRFKLLQEGIIKDE